MCLSWWKADGTLTCEAHVCAPSGDGTVVRGHGKPITSGPKWIQDLQKYKYKCKGGKSALKGICDKKHCDKKHPQVFQQKMG